MSVSVRPLSAAEADRERIRLGAILVDCVAGGASIGFMAPFTAAEADEWWGGIIHGVDVGRTILFGAFVEGRLSGSVQLGLDMPANQPHRGSLMKLIVHREARRLGLASRLVTAAEADARARGRTLLTLDTVSGSPAEALYLRLGWTKTGEIPNYALFPDGEPTPTSIFWKAL